jgi:hypothetical protein
MTKQKGFAHTLLIIGLALTLMGALGFIFWQNFIYKEPVTTKTEFVKGESDKKSSNEPKKMEASKAPLTKPALAAALPDGCSLGISDGSHDFDIRKLTKVTKSSPSLGPLKYRQHGRINEDRNWTYVAGGCGSSAGAFVLKDNASTWKLVAYHTGDAWFGCEKVDGLNIPKEVVGLCLDGSNERAIR